MVYENKKDTLRKFIVKTRTDLFTRLMELSENLNEEHNHLDELNLVETRAQLNLLKSITTICEERGYY